MILGIGIDTVEISRMAKSLTIPSFLTSTFTIFEIANEHGNREEYYATRFCGMSSKIDRKHSNMSA